MAATLKETMAVKRVADNKFSASPFFERGRQGNVLPLQYGGIALAQAVSAGQATVKDDTFEVYSIQGTYLGPASTEVPTTYTVDDIRTTRSFCTRFVTASQKITIKGETLDRKVLVALLDYHKKETEVMLEYSNTPMFPMTEYGKPENLPSIEEHVDETLSSKAAAHYKKSFHLFLSFMDARWVPGCKAAQNVFGWSVGRASSQDKLPITKRTNGVWVKTREKLEKTDQMPALAFYMDGALAFLPLTFSGQPLNAASACSSLDFSLHIFAPTDFSEWHLQEQHTESGGGARTFSIGRMWDIDGKEIACMTQSSILRPGQNQAKL